MKNIIKYTMVNMTRPTDFSPKIGIALVKPELQDKTKKLAIDLDLPMTVAGETYDFILNYSDQGLELFLQNDPDLTGSVMVDFVQGKSGYRRTQGGSEMLIRAIGHKKNRATSVLDATGGFGYDSFIMAAHGCSVHIIEKNPVVAALLEDGLHRAAEHPDTKEISGRIRFTTGDSCLLLGKEKETGQYDVIYLDPMFPKRSKSARVKKELQILQLIVEENSTDTLFTAALKKARKRVVVKRPKKAPPMSGRPPTHSISSKTIRFDVYLV